MTDSQPPAHLHLHSLSDHDRGGMSALRDKVLPQKGKRQGIAGRAEYDGIMDKVAEPVGIAFHPDVVGGVPGWWCLPPGAKPGAALLHLHGGWFIWGSAAAYRHFAGQIAVRTHVETFVPDYALAPERPFPAGLRDVQAVYDALALGGERRVGISGDSAGGNLALLLARSAYPYPAGVAVVSPVTDLSLSSNSWLTKADDEIYFTRLQVEQIIRTYLDGRDARDSDVSPLVGPPIAQVPVRIHVGDQEVLLDDALSYARRAAAAGTDVRVDVWEGMPHDFITGAGHFEAADAALDAIGTFLLECLFRASSP